MNSLNPLKYHPAQLAKSIAALLTSVVAFLGLLAASLSDGGLATAGGWVAGVAVVLTPIAVFATKMAPLLGMFAGADELGAEPRAGE
ncbi:hypothetical protein [Nocardia australiensis]|uniref:hypothetical protein n=1 Tax=Nocardia australiensis TaxID=2887191 RepID=UPI001D145D78|nr:hypothetical protein [Nocardia australiensis]